MAVLTWFLGRPLFMSFSYAIPSDALKPFVKHYWGLEKVFEQGASHTQRVMATGLPELIFYFGRKPEASNRQLEGNVLLNAQQNDFYDLILSERLSLFAVTFHPEGLSRFWTIPLQELQNQSLYLGLLDKTLAAELEEKLENASCFPDRVQIVEAVLIRLLGQRPFSVDHHRMSSTIALIKSTQGRVLIDALAQDACLSRKQFERKFIAHIGLSPKQYLKIIRFQYALYLHQQNTSGNLTELAYRAGYYDQSHFVNDVRELAGYSPKKLFKETEIVSDFFS